jgi:hypothetical protein
MTQWNGSLIMGEFAKIASDSGLISTDFKKTTVGNPDKPNEVITRCDPTKEYKNKSENDVLELAHPESITVVDSFGDGGLVEDLKEQEEKFLDIVSKRPNGALIGVHANLIKSLTKLASDLDSQGKYKEAIRVDQAIFKLTQYPFQSRHLNKEAFLGVALTVVSVLASFAPMVIDWFKTTKGPNPGQRIFKSKVQYNAQGVPVTTSAKPTSRLVKGVGVAGVALSLLIPFAHKFMSLQEGIIVDLKDLLDRLKDEMNDNNEQARKIATEAYNMLNPSYNAISKLDFSKKENMDLFKQEIQKLISYVPQLEQYILTITKIVSTSFFGSTLESKLESFKDSLIEANDIASEMDKIGERGDMGAKVAFEEINNFTPDKSIESLQEVLFKRGFPKGNTWQGDITGELDEDTINATHQLEQKLDNVLENYNEKNGLQGSWGNKIINENSISIDIGKLNKILDLIEKKGLV